MVNHQQICGTCAFAGAAYNFDGSRADDFINCQVKAIQTKGRRPDPKAITSAVFRMHYNRQACAFWQPAFDIESSHHQPEENQFVPDGIINQIVEAQQRKPSRLSNAPPPTPQNSGELNQLKGQLLQKDQMITSLQQQNHHLLDEIKQLKKEMKTLVQAQTKNPAVPSIDLDFFKLLGVTTHTSPDELKQAYREKVKMYHPDKFIALAQRLNLAYETLKNPLKRKNYIQSLSK